MWAQALSVALGIWLMAAPAVLGYNGLPADNDHVIGPLAASFACIAIWEATRGARWVNVPLGAWLLIAPWFLGHGQAALLNSLIAGVLLIGLGFVRGTSRERLGGGWAALLPGR
jgi:hypothetical protein